MKFTGLTLQTADPERLATFYAGILEVPVHQITGGFCIQLGTTQILLQKAAAGAAPYYHLAFSIPANQIEAARTWLKPKVELLWMNDYKSDIADFVNWNAKSVYFFDPAGNILELIARFDLNNARQDVFGGQSLLSVNEVGLVFPAGNFDASVSALRQQFDLPYFIKQPPLPQFRAIGDEEGLFIAVPGGRNWYPTTTLSIVAPVAVNFVHMGKEYTFSI